VIAVKKLDGSMMHLNEDLIERVENAAEGQSAIYLTDGARMIVANTPDIVIERIRAEKTALLRRVMTGPDEPSDNEPSTLTDLNSRSQRRAQ
jgi:uncharacterized protein YlzI (FlbEa/FlbD family)